MKIKLAILERDTSYLGKIVSVFNVKYGEKFEIYSFTDKGVALDTLDSAKIDVLLADDSYEIDSAALPNRCAFAYLVDSADVDAVADQRAIFKYQKIDLIYKQVLGVFAEKASLVSGLKTGSDSGKVIVFSSAAGGVGNSSMAAACAVHFAVAGRRTLYLNLERFGGADVFFTAEGLYDMSDVIFAVKSKKANLALKLESCVRQERSGVYFYAQPKYALDMMEFGSSEILELISELQITGSYDYIIVDMDFAIDKNAMNIYHKAHGVVFVGDGSEIANQKIVRAYKAIEALEQNTDAPLTKRMSLIYNKFSNKTGNSIEDAELKVLGGAPRYEHAQTKQIVSQLSSLELFDQIVRL